MMDTLLAIGGIVLGLASLGGYIYIFAYWKGGVDEWRKKHDEDHKNSLPLCELSDMCKTMYEIYVVDALRRRPDLATHQSPYTLTDGARLLIPEPIKEILCQINRRPENREDLVSGYLVVKHLGIDRIETIAKDMKLSVQEAIAILSTFLDNTNNHHPV